MAWIRTVSEGQAEGALAPIYAAAMQRSGIVWTEENLREFLLDPQGFVRGNRMPFSGFSDPTEADAVIGYLKEQQ